MLPSAIISAALVTSILGSADMETVVGLSVSSVTSAPLGS